MVEGQCGTYLRLTRASSGLRVSVTKTGSLLYSTAEEGHCDLAEIFILVLVSSLYVLATLTRGPDVLSSVLGKCRTVPLPYLFVKSRVIKRYQKLAALAQMVCLWFSRSGVQSPAG